MNNSPILPVNIRVVIACWDEGDRPTAQILAQRMAPIVDAIASGAKLTKADAARMGVSEDQLSELDGFRDWFLSVLNRHPGRGLYVFVVTPPSMSPSPSPTSARQGVRCPQGCLPPDCFCYTLLGFGDYPKLQTIDSEDPVFAPSWGSSSGSAGNSSGGGSSGGTGGSGGGAGGSGGGSGGAGGGSGSGSGGPGGGRRIAPILDPSRPIVIIVFDRPGTSRAQIEDLVRETLRSQQVQQRSPRLVIKTKSTPP